MHDGTLKGLSMITNEDLIEHIAVHFLIIFRMKRGHSEVLKYYSTYNKLIMYYITNNTCELMIIEIL